MPEVTEQVIYALVYPNPLLASGTIKVRGSVPVNYFELKIVDALGKDVYKRQVKGDEIELSADDFDPGIYFYSIP